MVPQSGLGDDDVMGHVHQTARKVAGVGGLQRGVGQTFASAVRRDEVFKYGKPSRKLDRMGFSIISPMPPVSFFWGLAIRPRMPASCLTCWRLPRAPESAIMKTELKRASPSL